MHIELNSTIVSVLRVWRVKVINKVLSVGAILVLPAVIMTNLRTVQNPSETLGATLITLIYLGIIILAFLRKLNPVLRGSLSVLLIYAAGVISMVRGGLVGDGRVYLIVVPVLAITLVGIRLGWWMTVVSLLTYLAFTFFAKYGYLERWLIIRVNPVSMDHWGYDGLVLVAFMFLMVLLLTDYINLLMKTLDSEHKTAEDLQEAYNLLDETNLLLEEKVEQRTAELAEANQLLLHIATHDPLTGLPNRSVFYDRLTHALAKSKRHKGSIVILFIDLDDFKNVNDTFGHLVGDWLLQETAKRLTDCVRESDTLARLGGDEFAVILEDLSNLEDASIVADKILKGVSSELEIGDQLYSISASIGISVFPVDGESPEDLIRNSDTAMYRVKNSTKNNYEFFSPLVLSSTR